MGWKGFAFAWLYLALHLPPLSIHIHLSMHQPMNSTPSAACHHALCSPIAHNAASANNNWIRHCIIARCSMQARPVRFHSQAQGYMFHDAGTNVK